MARRARRKASLGSMIVSMIIFLAIGGFFLVTGFREFIDSKKIPVDFNTISSSELKSGMVLEGDLNFNFGKFLESYRTKNGVKTGSSTYYYMIPAGQDATLIQGPFMALKGHTKVNSQLDSQANKIFQLSEGFEADPGTVHIKGRLKKLKDKDREYLEDYMSQMGFTSSEISSMIVPFTFEYSNFDTYGIFFIIGGLFCLIGLIYAIPGIISLKRQRGVPAGNGSAYNGADPFNQPGNGASQNPYAQNMDASQNPYGQNMGTSQNPYGQNMDASQNPYGQNMGASQNPYGQNMGASQNPYGQNNGNDNNNF